MVNQGRRSVEERSKQHKTKLRESLLNNAKKLYVKFREWDIDGDGLVDKEEFRNAIPKMGIRSPAPSSSSRNRPLPSLIQVEFGVDRAPKSLISRRSRSRSASMSSQLPMNV